jgi:Leucine-rich repeat (LRR) protein
LKHIRELDSFVGLEQLELVNTTISSIPSSIDKLQNLMELGLSYNKLSYLPENIFNLPELSLLYINDNYFSADEIETMQTKFRTLRPDMTLIV